MKKRVDLIAAPPAMSPGGYVAKAYADRVTPSTAFVNVATEIRGGLRTISLAWLCPKPSKTMHGATDLFLDAAGIMVPLTDDAPLMLMGQPGNGVEVAYWRAERDQLLLVHAEGLGSTVRAAPPSDWSVVSDWSNGVWGVTFKFPAWHALVRAGKFGVAVWRGDASERGGLKSVSPDWINFS